MFFEFFYPRINKSNICHNIIGISNFQNALNDLFSSTGFYFKSKVIEGSLKGKNMFFNFWTLLLKMLLSTSYFYKQPFYYFAVKTVELITREAVSFEKVFY